MLVLCSYFASVAHNRPNIAAQLKLIYFHCKISSMIPFHSTKVRLLLPLHPPSHPNEHLALVLALCLSLCHSRCCRCHSLNCITKGTTGWARGRREATEQNGTQIARRRMESNEMLNFMLILILWFIALFIHFSGDFFLAIARPSTTKAATLHPSHDSDCMLYEANECATAEMRSMAVVPFARHSLPCPTTLRISMFMNS